MEAKELKTILSPSKLFERAYPGIMEDVQCKLMLNERSTIVKRSIEVWVFESKQGLGGSPVRESPENF